MGHWNYRIVKRVYNYNGEIEEEFSVREVYYNNAGEICAFSSEPRAISGETLEYLKENLERCLRATEKEILIEDGFVFAKDDYNLEEDLRDLKDELKNDFTPDQIDKLISDIRKDFDSEEK